jgi:hypothetical protein
MSLNIEQGVSAHYYNATGGQFYFRIYILVPEV